MLSIFLVLLFVSLVSCAGKSAAPDQQEMANEPQLDKAYNSIVVSNFESAGEIGEDYPEAAQECQSSMIAALLMKNVYKSVTVGDPNRDYQEGTLLVKATIKDMRIVSTAARIWGGAMAGSSYMDMDITLIDAATLKEIRKKELSSANNAFAAAWVGGSSDKSMTADMGQIIAGYILSVVKPG